jgi:T-complex protein 1 subunit theta
MLKEGYRHYAGLEEAILRNISAAKELSMLTRTSFGPNGMKKMVVNHIDKIFVTGDSSTILRESEINHPAAKLIAMAAKMQKEDWGDSTNYVVTLAGELLTQAELLIKTGLHPSAIISGFQIGLDSTLKILETEVQREITDIKQDALVVDVMTSALASKLPNNYQFFGNLLTKACRSILQERGRKFNPDNIRFVKLLGGNVEHSSLVPGFVISRSPEGDFKNNVNIAKIACFNCPFDPQGGETKGTVLITKAEELLNYSSTEEALAERIVRSIVDTGVNVVVVGGSISELCLHYLNKYNVFVLKVHSKFELARLSKTVGGQMIPKLGAPIPEEIGFAESVKVSEIGSTRVTVFNVKNVDVVVTTIVIRGATTTIMDDIERSLENGVSCFKQILNDPRYVFGAGAVEAFLANKLEEVSSSLTGLEQYSCLQFGQAFEVFVRILLENAGLNANEQTSNVLSQNVNKALFGVNVFKGVIESSSDINVYDNLGSKSNAILLAANVVLTILRIDQIIVAKPSGGPKPRENKGWDND